VEHHRCRPAAASDLIPNLVETVKGFANHETEVFKNIADARAAMAGARNPAGKDRR
jgi:LemA protein